MLTCVKNLVLWFGFTLIKDRYYYNLDNKISKNYIMFGIIYDYISFSKM